MKLTRELLNCIEFQASSGIDHGYTKLSPDGNMDTYLEQARYIEEGLLHIPYYEDQGEVYETPLKQSIVTALLGPDVFTTDMPTHKATPLSEPWRTRPDEALRDVRAYSDSQLPARETNHCSSTRGDLQNYRIRDTREPNYYDQNATPFQQIRPYDNQQTMKYLFLKRERGEGEGIRARQEATNDYLQEGTDPRQNLPTPSEQTGNPPMQRRLLPSPLSSPTLTRRHQ